MYSLGFVLYTVADLSLSLAQTFLTSLTRKSWNLKNFEKLSLLLKVVYSGINLIFELRNNFQLNVMSCFQGLINYGMQC